MRRLFKVGADRHDSGKVTFSWHPEGNFLATAGRNGIVHITDRHGDIVDEIPMSTASPILGLEWDKDGENLAILQEGNGIVPLWNLPKKSLSPVETSLRDPTFLCWSKTGPQLAIGTAKGSLLIYHKGRKQKIPLVGKHSKAINCGMWSMKGNKLVLGSEDRTITISNENGDTLLHTEMKLVPVQANFVSSTKLFYGGTASSSAQLQLLEENDNVVSVNLSGRSLYLYNILNDKDDPLELIFERKYGEIISHSWVSDELLLVGFSEGYLAAQSVAPHEIGREKFCTRFHKSRMTTVAYNPHMQRAAAAGDDGVVIVDTRDFTEVKADFISTHDLEEGRVTSLAWSPDGQILTIGTSAGNVYNFLAKMAVLYAHCRSNVAYLSSLREIAIVDTVKRGRPIDVTVELEPSLLALGPKHVAAGMNQLVYYHSIADSSSSEGSSSSSFVQKKEYVGKVFEVQLNSKYAAVLTDTKAMLHSIEPSSSNESRTFPSREEGSFSKVTCIALTEDFLFYGTEAGSVEVFSLSEWELLSGAELRLNKPIKKLYPNLNGTRVVVVDSSTQSFLFNPVTGGGVNQSIAQFEDAPSSVQTVIWDQDEKNVIMMFDGKYVHSFIYIQNSIKGTLLTKLGPVVISSEGEISLTPDKIELNPGNVPILSTGGMLTCQTVAGSLSSILHPFFLELDPPNHRSKQQSRNRDDELSTKKDKKLLANKFCQAIALLKLNAAWEVALELDRRQFWLALSHRAMELMNIELASRVFRQLGDAGMVMALQECMYVEDRNLLAGHIQLLFGNYTAAQEFFLNSSRPTVALDMRRDLLQWDKALTLSQVLSPPQVPDICIRYGQQLEFRDDADSALKMFEDALAAQDEHGVGTCPQALVPVAMMGVARCTLRLGNIRQGIRLANELDDKQLFIDCAGILEGIKQYSDAASMFLKGQQYERAAELYIKHLIKADNTRISEAAVIMAKVTNDNLNSSFAKVCIAAKRFDDALKAYQRANDIDKVVELKLRHMDQVQQAFDLVRESASSQGAQYVADYCQETSDYRGAIEFLLLANKSDEAFKLAQSQSIVEAYCSFLGDTISAEDAMKVANYYEKSQKKGQAGRFYSLCGQYSKALRLFIQCGDEEIDAAIEVVGKSQNDNLTHQLIDFLLGEKDGIPKDQNYIYRLYLALKKYDEAAKTALIISRDEQDHGNYSLAHSVVVETVRQLEAVEMKVPSQLRLSFVLLHSYILVKSFVRRGDHEGAARLLLRIAQNLSKFPMHAVQILTSTVVECQRAGLKASSYEYAVMLMRPEYRPNIDANLKRKIEAIVRRRTTLGDSEVGEKMSPCPLSSQEIPIMQLDCPTTRDALPMCIVTGRHMVLDDWCFCPNSKLPALYSEYIRYIQDEVTASSTTESPSITSTSTSSSRHESKEKEGAKLSPVAANAISRSVSAADPVMGKSVSISDLTVATPAEALLYIQRYNNVIEKKKTEEQKQMSSSSGGEMPGDDDDEAAAANGGKKGSTKAARTKLDRTRRAKSKRSSN